jgi:AraC-like DNA-binding protein
MRERLKMSAERHGELFLYAPRGRAIPGHSHDELECTFVVRGRARWILDDRRYDLGTHCLVWLFPGQEHRLVDLSEDFAMWILVLKPAALARWCRAERYRALLARRPPGHHCRRLADADARRLRALIEGVAERWEDPQLGDAGLAHATLAAWDAFARAPADLAGVALHPAVERAAAMLARADADLAAVAGHAGLSRSRLGAVFRRQVGLSLGAYRNRQRIERFCRLAARPRANLLDCALTAGFGSYPQFHRVFRGLMGVTPRAWRRERP